MAHYGQSSPSLPSACPFFLPGGGSLYRLVFHWTARVCPAHWFGKGTVEVFDEVAQTLLHFADRFEVAMTKDTTSHDAEYDLVATAAARLPKYRSLPVVTDKTALRQW